MWLKTRGFAFAAQKAFPKITQSSFHLGDFNEAILEAF